MDPRDSHPETGAPATPVDAEDIRPEAGFYEDELFRDSQEMRDRLNELMGNQSMEEEPDFDDPGLEEDWNQGYAVEKLTDGDREGEVRRLKTMAPKTSNILDKYFAGWMLFALFSRARWSDLASMQSFFFDVIYTPEGPFGFVEATTRIHKTSNSAEKKALYLRFVALIWGVGDELHEGLPGQVVRKKTFCEVGSDLAQSDSVVPSPSVVDGEAPQQNEDPADISSTAAFNPSNPFGEKEHPEAEFHEADLDDVLPAEDILVLAPTQTRVLATRKSTRSCSTGSSTA
eukprot:s64_g27.t1